MYIIGYVRLQGHNERDTTITYTSYDNDLDYTLDLLNYTEYMDIKTMSMNSLGMDVTRFLWHQKLWYIHTN